MRTFAPSLAAASAATEAAAPLPTTTISAIWVHCRPTAATAGVDAAAPRVETASPAPPAWMKARRDNRDRSADCFKNALHRSNDPKPPTVSPASKSMLQIGSAHV